MPNRNLLLIVLGLPLAVVLGCSGSDLTTAQQPTSRSWETQAVVTQPDPDLYAVHWEPEHWDNPKFVCGGDEHFDAWSENGLDWEGGNRRGTGRTRGYASTTLIHMWVGSDGVVGGDYLDSHTALRSIDEQYAVGLNGVACNGQRFVVVGEGGLVVTTEDAIDFTVRDAGVTANLMDVIWDGSSFFVSGDDGVVRTSSDGISWQEAFPPAGMPLRALAQNGSALVALADGGVVMLWSGSQWSRIETNRTLEDVVWFNGRFVAVGPAGTILTSPDGETWRRETSGTTGDLHAVSSGPIVVAVGDAGTILASVDGATWKLRQPPRFQLFSDAAWVGGRFVVPALQNVFASANGSDWTRTTETSGFVDIGRIDGSDAGFVGAGQHAQIFDSQHLTVRYSEDLAHWEVVHEEPTVHWPSFVEWTGGRFFVGGDTGILLNSTDGRTWASQYVGFSNTYVGGIAAYPDGYVAVVGANAVRLDKGLNEVGRVVSAFAPPVKGVVWTGKRFLAHNWDTIYTSTDGIGWTMVGNGTGLTDMVWTGREVAICGKGQVLISADGTDWTAENPDVDLNLYGIAASPSEFLVVGHSGILRTRGR